MRSRKKVSESTQAEVLVQSRRRCCICFGLNRDESIKKGQIAHLDQDRNNNATSNLAFLCLEHHDEYDSQTSQSKGLQRAEIERYRDELVAHFGGWVSPMSGGGLLNFLSFQIDLEAMAKAAIRAGGSAVFYGEAHAFNVLITDAVDYCDGDLYMPHLHVLDHFASWGWLTFTYEEREVPDEMARVYIEVARKPICDTVAEYILDARRKRGEGVNDLLNTAHFRGWIAPKERQ